MPTTQRFACGWMAVALVVVFALPTSGTSQARSTVQSDSASSRSLGSTPQQTSPAGERVAYLNRILRADPGARSALEPAQGRAAAAAVPLALIGATVVDGRGGDPLLDGNVVIQDGRIVCVGPSGSCTPPEGALSIDAQGKWITPGLVDAHVHYSQTGWADGRPDSYDARDRFPYASTIRKLHEEPQRFYRSYLCSGVTATFDVGGYPWTWDLGVRTEFDPMAPHIAAAGPLLSARDHWVNLPAEKQFLYMADEATVAEDVQYLLSNRTDAVKVWYIVDGQSPDTTRWKALLHLAAGQAHAAQVPFIVHASNLWAAKVAVGAGARLLVHSVSDRSVDEEFLGEALQAGTFYTPTLIVGQGYDQLRSRSFQAEPYELACVDPETRHKAFLTDSLPDAPTAEVLAATARAADAEARIEAANLLAVQSAGIPVVVGTDAGNPLTLHGPAIFLEMEAMARAGLRPSEVLTAATENGARLMGRLDDFGTVEQGKIADLVVLDADPLEDVGHLRQIALVIRRGHVHAQSELTYPEGG